MPNPSTIAADLHDRLADAKAVYHNLGFSKSTREAALANIRTLEEQLDLPEAERTPNHNGRGGKHEPSSSDDILVRIERILGVGGGNPSVAVAQVSDIQNLLGRYRRGEL